MNDRIITKSKIMVSVVQAIFHCIGVDDDSESASNSVAQVISESFEAPTFSNASAVLTLS